MIRFYFHPTPNPAKVSLFLEESGLPYEVIPVDTSKGEQHTPDFRAINPNSKVPAIVDTDGPGGKETRIFDSTAILIYLAEKTDKFLGAPESRPELLSWLLFLASGLGPFSGQSVHFQFAAPEGNDYAVNRYRREAERHYQVLDDHLQGRQYIVGDDYTIADMSAWGWLDRASRVRKGADDPLAPFPNLKRLFETVDARPAAGKARTIAQDHPFKKGERRRDQASAFPVQLSTCGLSGENASRPYTRLALSFPRDMRHRAREPGTAGTSKVYVQAAHKGQNHT
jgi:GST-like protein